MKNFVIEYRFAGSPVVHTAEVGYEKCFEAALINLRLQHIFSGKVITDCVCVASEPSTPYQVLVE